MPRTIGVQAAMNDSKGRRAAISPQRTERRHAAAIRKALRGSHIEGDKPRARETNRRQTQARAGKKRAGRKTADKGRSRKIRDNSWINANRKRRG